MAKLSPMGRLVLEIMEEAHANGENTLTEDQISERVNAKMQAVAHAYRMALQWMPAQSFIGKPETVQPVDCREVGKETQRFLAHATATPPYSYDLACYIYKV
jgi:hypothetical protein